MGESWIDNYQQVAMMPRVVLKDFHTSTVLVHYTYSMHAL